MSARFDDKLNVLVIEGEPTNKQLLKALEDIETEFNDLTGNKPDELKKIDEINALNARNRAVEGWFFCLDEVLRRANAPYLDILPRLRTKGIRISWNGDIENFKQQIESAKIRDISKQVELEELSKKLEKTQSLSTSSPKFTKKNFQQLINSVQSLGFKISKDETDMFAFGTMCFDYFELSRKQGTN
jgi:hypothetical protein